MRLNVRTVACPAALFLLNACGIFAEEKQSQDDAGDQADDACPRGECRALPDYGDLGMVQSAAFLSVGRAPITWATRIAGDCDAEGVKVYMELVDERGVFRGTGIEPGSYAIDGAELDIETCGICLRLLADETTDHPTCYLATGGTLTLTSTEDRLIGGLEAVTFQPITCFEFERIDNGCSSAIEHVEFETEIGSIEN